MLIVREISEYLLNLADKYPVVTITGPRQSGKTTLAREVFKDKVYINLEAMDNREYALSDPRGFLNGDLKYRFNQGKRNNLNFYRDSAGNEIDVVYNIAQDVLPIEIKAGETVAADFLLFLSFCFFVLSLTSSFFL